MSKPIAASVLFTVLAGLPGQALAYSKPGHHQITNAAWQILRAASSTRTGTSAPEVALKSPGTCSNGTGLCGATVSNTEWTTFLAELDKTRRIIGSMPAQIPNKADGSCYQTRPNIPVAEIAESIAPDHWDLNHEKCSVDSWKPFGLYNDVVVPVDGSKMQGKVLGWHAKNRDDDVNESVMDVIPVGGAVADTVNQGFNVVVGSILLPWVCFGKWLFNKGDGCIGDALRYAQKANPGSALYALIPGFEVKRREDYIGFWHLMNVRSSSLLMNSYDNNQGMYLPQGGPAGVAGASDHAAMNLFHIGGFRIDPTQSTGVSRYQIKTSADGHSASKNRRDVDWRRQSVAFTQFTPLDNLAYWGFENLKSDPIKRLGWPLHAIGDATVPHHVVATTSYGHVPYETWVEKHWDELVFEQCRLSEGGCLRSTTLPPRQLAQAQRVLQIAYRWRQYLRTHGVRDFITDLGKQTLSKVGDSLSAWAWCDQCSAFMDLDMDSTVISDFAQGVPDISIPGGRLTPLEVASDPLRYYNSHWDNIRGLVEDAMGAKLAFLAYATSRTAEYPQCIISNSYGCRTKADCCSAADSCIANSCFIPQ